MPDSANSSNWSQPYFANPGAMSTSPKVVQAAIQDIIEQISIRITKPVSEWVVLDVGCAQGLYTHELSKYVKHVVGVEPYKELFEVAQRFNQGSANVTLYHLPVEQLNCDKKFDLVLSLTTVEHMPDARTSFERVLEMMNSGAILFLTAPNKLWPLEAHYRLPFLSWLPLSWANRYLRIFKKGQSYESCAYSRTYWGMKKLFSGLPCTVEFCLPDLKKNWVGMGQQSGFHSALRTLGVALIRRAPLFWAISKGFILLIVKK
jgi:2-polyprenyl-3-methyl-5-hydroxy-6-metoxy-1,4-benzoquinol methylase